MPTYQSVPYYKRAIPADFLTIFVWPMAVLALPLVSFLLLLDNYALSFMAIRAYFLELRYDRGAVNAFPSFCWLHSWSKHW
jgi:hypothetical protein